MSMNISQKILAIMAAFFFIPLLMFGATLNITNQQKDDGLVINLAGRQRMLSQKMSKECLAYIHLAMMKDQPGADKTRKALLNTMAVFEVTLNALIHSGQAPLSLDLKGSKAQLPAAHGMAATQLKEVDKLWKPFKSAIEQVLEKQRQEDVQAVLVGNLPLLTNMNTAVGILQKQAEKKVATLFYTQVACMLLGLLVVGLIVWWSKINIVRPIQSGADLSRKLAAGDLTHSIQVDQDDEIGLLAEALNKVSRKLNQMIREVSEGVETLASSSAQMGTISEQMSSGAEDTVAKSNMVASAAEEMNSNIGSVAAAMEEASVNVKTVAASSGELAQRINKVNKDTNQTLEVTQQAVRQTEVASERINELGQAAEEIGMVTETIRAISDKTNLLALNATIEAARAGEAGKGFAVVANEIKDLAAQTADATQDIGKKLKGIQDSTGSTVSEIEQISKVINQVAQFVAGIADELVQQDATTAEISENVNQASMGLDEINVNINQSSEAVGQVAREITEVNEAANQTLEHGTHIKQSSMDLKGLAQKLQELVSRFTI